MYVLNSELHLRRARTIADSPMAIAQYMRAIEEAVRELKEIGPLARSLRHR